MSARDEFLKNFDSISNKFTNNISIYCAFDINNLLGISYFQLNRTSNELSEYFSRIFTKNSQYIGVSVSEYFLLPSIILGIWKSGHCFAGLGTQYTRNSTLNFIDFLGIKYIISDKKENEYEGTLLTQFSIHKQTFYVWCKEIQTVRTLSLDSFSYGIMTSGTTGEPKIIQVPWSCILPNVHELSAEFQVTKNDCIFQASPYSFDPFFIELLMTFLSGSSLMIVSNIIKLSPSNLLKILFGNFDSDSITSFDRQTTVENHFEIVIEKVKRKNITILQMTPSVFQRWSDDDIQNFILSDETQLRILILGGEKFPKNILTLKHPKNTSRIFNIYGITEISCWAFLNEIKDKNLSKISIGKPLKSISYKITENNELQIGSKERICLLNNENTVHAGNTVYRNTGDIVKLSNNKLYIEGRCDEVVKKFGMKINLNKIENSFLNVNSSIKKCFCVFDDENLKLGLFYVPDEIKEVESFRFVTVEEFFKKKYKIPIDDLKEIEKPDYFIEISKPPLNSHGKCDKKILLDYLKNIKNTKHPPEDLESIFRKHWVEVLGFEKTNQSSLSFIELGGNSILGLKLISKLEEEGFTVPQNFITEVLGQGNYKKCFNCLSLAQEENGIPRKRIKLESETSDVSLSLKWKFDLGKCVDATPVIFLYDGKEKLVVGSHSSKLSCINPGSGSEIWTINLGDRIESGFKPTKDGSRGFVGCYDHHIYCISSSDGRIIWKFKTNDMIKSTPCLSSNEEIIYVASYDKNLYCISSTEGTLLKSLKLSNGGIFSSGIVSDSLNCFFIGTLDGVCVSINQETNEPNWKTELGSPIFASPCLIPEKPQVLFAEVLGVVHCLNATNGEKMWSFKAEGNIYSSPTVRNDIRHIMFGCHDAHLYCLQYGKEEPELKWRQQMDSFVFAKPLVLYECSSVFAVTTKGFVYLCDLDGGFVKTRFKFDGEVFSSPVHRNDQLFVGCRDNYVYSLEISTMR